MGCTPPIRTVQIAEREVVFSVGGANPGVNGVFVMSPNSLMEIATLMDRVRATLRVENKTVNFEGQVVYQLSDDGETWDSPVAVDTGDNWVGANGYSTTPWRTLSPSKRAIRFGLLARQATGSTVVESAQVSVVIDIGLVS